jgi:hypothetical protein
VETKVEWPDKNRTLAVALASIVCQPNAASIPDQSVGSGLVRDSATWRVAKYSESRLTL